MTNNTPEDTSDFYAFPASRVQQIDNKVAADEPYRSPHLARILAAQGGVAGRPDTAPAPVQQPVGMAPRTGDRAGPQNLQARQRRATNMTSNLDHQIEPLVTVAPTATPQPVHSQRPHTRTALPQTHIAASSTPEFPTGEVAVSPGFTGATSEVEASVLALPSRYHYYDFKDLYAAPFKGRQLAKLSRSHTEGSLLLMVEAVSSVLSTSQGFQHLAFDLTPPDFQAVLYWLRLNSFTRVAYVHSFHCESQDHIDRVHAGELGYDTLQHAVTVKKSMIKTVELVDVPLAPTLANPDLYVSPCTMRDVLLMTEHPRLDSDPDFAFHAGLAVYVRSHTQDLTFDERVAIVEDMDADDVRAITEYDALASNYGVTESLDVRCPVCGTQRKSAIALQAYDFFH